MFSATSSKLGHAREQSRKSPCPTDKSSLPSPRGSIESHVDTSELSKEALFSIPERNLVTLQGNCLDLMSRIYDKSVDMIFCDLPYGTTRNAWDSILSLDILWAHYERVIKDNGAIVLTAAAPFDKVLGVSNLALFRYQWIWNKNKSTGHLNARKMPLRAHELVLVFYKKPPEYNPQMTDGHKPKNRVNLRDLSEAELTNLRNYGPAKRIATPGGTTVRYPRDVLNIPVHNNDCLDKWHPTQKPVELAEYMIRTYTTEGAVILDNCMGSGSTGIAALNTNRGFIGIELDKGYYKKANAWLAGQAVG